MAWWEWLLWAAVIACVVLPPRYDPAIWLKQWIEKKGRGQ